MSSYIWKTSVAVVVGAETPASWSQTIHGSGWYAVVETADPAGNARTVGASLVSGLTELFGGTQSLEDIDRRINSLVTQTHGSIRTLLIAYEIGDGIRIFQIGNGIASLKRHDRFAKLLDHPGSVSGRVYEGDIFLLQSEMSAAALPLAEALGTFDHLPAGEVAGQITLKMEGIPGGPQGASLVVGMVGKEEKREASFQPVTSNEKESIRNVVGKTDWIIRTKRMIRPRTRMVSVSRRLNTYIRRFRGIDLRITGIVAVVFVACVVLGVRHEMSLKTDAQTQKSIAAAQKLYEEGVALTPLNPVKARDALSQAKTVIAPLPSKVPSTTKDGRVVAELVKNIDDAYRKARREYNVDPQLFYDISFLKSGSRATDMALYDDTIALVDPAMKTAYAVSVSTKNGQIVGGGDGFDNAGLVAIHGDSIYVLSTSGIHAISIRDRKTVKNIIPAASDWGKISSFVAFAGNLYLLDQEKGRIWKYLSTDSGISKETKEYLNPDVLPNFQDATGFAIDGSVWVGYPDGKLTKFTQGQTDTFNPSGIDPAISGPIVAYASDETDHLYLLDEYGKRVVVLDKDGIYAAQYVWKSPVTPTKLVVSEKSGKMLLLADGKVYSIDLNQK